MMFFAGNDSTFTFLQNVLDEILPLFPNTYILVVMNVQKCVGKVAQNVKNACKKII
jgi:hypothetical protein